MFGVVNYRQRLLSVQVASHGSRQSAFLSRSRTGRCCSGGSQVSMQFNDVEKGVARIAAAAFSIGWIRANPL
jgi:hypothetical protein